MAILRLTQTSTGQSVVDTRRTGYAHFIFGLLMSQRFREEVTGHTNGTTVNMLPVDGLQRPLFAVPPPTLIVRYEEQASPLFARIEAGHEESVILAAVRDAMLPKLLSGEIRVKDAGKIAEGD